VFLIVVASTFPVVVPFIFIHDATVAIRLSNAVAIAMLAMIGFGYGKVAGISPWWMAGAMVALGLLLVSRYHCPRWLERRTFS
jgi:VIT1/CCC1 family predicted Fe2+/Mn2+ transporter